MGWTSKILRKTYSHSTFTYQDAFEFYQEQYPDYPLAMMYVHKAVDDTHHHEIYVLTKSPQGVNFIMVVLVDIINKEIFWKEIEESCGPTYYNCPKDFFKFCVAPNEYAIAWRAECSQKDIAYDYEQFNSL